MKIIADENIPCVEQAFASLGEVSLLPGRGMQPEQVRDADILLVRSVTAVDQRLLEGSSVRFVGSATIGFDHVDRAYLQQQGIGFATAPGCNAVSAAEYVVAALLVMAQRKDFDLKDKTVGIIGCGNVGSRVRSKLAVLGMRSVVTDPPLQAQGGHDDFVSLDEVLQADVITVHVPYIRDGLYPTHHLIARASIRWCVGYRPSCMCRTSAMACIRHTTLSMPWRCRNCSRMHCSLTPHVVLSRITGH